MKGSKSLKSVQRKWVLKNSEKINKKENNKKKSK